MGTIFSMVWQREALLKRIKKLDIQIEKELENELYREQSKEVDLLMREGLDYIAALRKVCDMYEKAHNHTWQDSDYELEKTFKDIITQDEELENTEPGITSKEL